MMFKRWVFLAIFLFVTSTNSLARTVRIGTVFDGPTREKQLYEAIMHETKSLMAEEFDLSFPSRYQLQGSWTQKSVQLSLNKLLRAKEVDVIVTLGLLSCHEACRRRKLAKPVIAPTIVEGTLPELPNKKGTSGVPNLNYLDTFASFERDVRIFREIVDFDELVVLVDRALKEGIPGISDLAIRTERNLGISILPVPIDNRATDPLDVLPKGVQAVFVTPLMRLSREQFKLLVQGLIKRKLPSFSWGGRPDVELGLLASNSREQDNNRIARRVAINIQRVLLGEDAGSFKTAFPGEEQLTINMATARAISVYPPWSVISDALLVNEEPESMCSRDLTTVVKLALKENLKLLAKEKEVSSAYERLRLARSRLLPQLDLAATQTVIDDDRARASLGSQRERTLRAGIQVSQLIYSDKARANVSIERDLHKSRLAQLEQVKLDITLEAAIAYLSLLQTQVQERIQRSNLRLTRSNLDRAKVRVSIGMASRSELYRWESEIARAKTRVFAAQAKRRQSLVALNLLLNRPLDEQCTLAPVTLLTKGLFLSGKSFKRYIRDPWSLEVLNKFIIQDALAKAPEIRQIVRAIAAQKRLFHTLRRSWKTPVVALKGELSERLAQEGDGNPADVLAGSPLAIALPRADNTDWNIGLSVSLPLSTGGERKAETKKALEELKRLRLLHRSTKQQIEAAVRSAFLATRATYPAIELTKAAATAARKNFALVADAYGRGVVSIIDLLDAQNAMLVSDESASNAVFAFLVDVLRVQRASGSFNLLKSEDELDKWQEALEAFYTRAKK